MSLVEKEKKFDLEDRTFQFARQVRALSKTVPATLLNREDLIQIVRASGSVGANYIEANNALGKKDFLLRIKICIKETKESGYWLRLIDMGSYPPTGFRAPTTDRGKYAIGEYPRNNLAKQSVGHLNRSGFGFVWNLEFEVWNLRFGILNLPSLEGISQSQLQLPRRTCR